MDRSTALLRSAPTNAPQQIFQCGFPCASESNPSPAPRRPPSSVDQDARSAAGRSAQAGLFAALTLETRMGIFNIVRDKIATGVHKSTDVSVSTTQEIRDPPTGATAISKRVLDQYMHEKDRDINDSFSQVTPSERRPWRSCNSRIFGDDFSTTTDGLTTCIAEEPFAFRMDHNLSELRVHADDRAKSCSQRRGFSFNCEELDYRKSSRVLRKQ